MQLPVIQHKTPAVINTRTPVPNREVHQIRNVTPQRIIPKAEQSHTLQENSFITFRKRNTPNISPAITQVHTPAVPKIRTPSLTSPRVPQANTQLSVQRRSFSSASLKAKISPIMNKSYRLRFNKSRALKNDQNHISKSIKKTKLRPFRHISSTKKGAQRKSKNIKELLPTLCEFLKSSNIQIQKKPSVPKKCLKDGISDSESTVKTIDSQMNDDDIVVDEFVPIPYKLRLLEDFETLKVLQIEIN